MEKLIVVIMGQNCERTIGMAIESVKDADAIIYCDGGSEDKTIDILNNEEFMYDLSQKRLKNKKIIVQDYDQEDLGMNGKQRNFYLNYLKENYPNDWALCIDADEVVGDINKVKEYIQTAIPGVYSVNMEHFIGNLGHLDATDNGKGHWVPNRLFKISEADKYPEVEHPVLKPKSYIEKDGQMISMVTSCTTIWHLAYIPNLWEIKKRYENHLKKSNIHTHQFLGQWYWDHIFGNYPTRTFFLLQIPPVILKAFGVDPDQLYFNYHSQLEVKHFVMAKEWTDYARKKLNMEDDYLSVLDIGCGVGIYGYVLQNYLQCDWIGYELSQWAVDNSPYFRKKEIIKGDIINTDFKKIIENYDVTLCIDVLEHLEENDLEKAIENIKETGKIFIFSLPFLGDPNLDADPTHKIKKSKEWWIEKLSKHLRIVDTPQEWHYANQIIVGERK